MPPDTFPNWGDVPTWLAIFAAVAAAIFAWKAVDHEKKRDKRREAYEKANQARRVAGWIGRDEGGAASDGMRYYIVLRNASELPIYRVTASVLKIPAEALHTAKVPFVVPGSSEVTHFQLPAATQERLCQLRTHTLDTEDFPGYSVEVKFEDANHEKWMRLGDGDLIEG